MEVNHDDAPSGDVTNDMETADRPLTVWPPKPWIGMGSSWPFHGKLCVYSVRWTCGRTKTRCIKCAYLICASGSWQLDLRRILWISRELLRDSSSAGFICPVHFRVPRSSTGEWGVCKLGERWLSGDCRVT